MSETTDYIRDPNSGALTLNREDLVRIRLLEKRNARVEATQAQKIESLEKKMDLIIELLSRK